MGPNRVQRITMRVLGIALIMISLGCLAALDESIEAGRTEMNEITPVPETELAERKMAVLRKKKPLGLPKPVPKRAYPKGWSADPRVREKHVKRDKAFEHFKLKNEQWHKSRLEHQAKSEKKRKSEKPIKEKKRKKALREKKAKERKIKKQGREKARKNGRGNEKTKKAAHREALRKKQGVEGKIKEKRPRSRKTEPRRRASSTGRSTSPRSRQKNQRSSGSSEKRCTSIASVPRERLLKNANSRRRPIMPRGPTPGPLGMLDISRRQLRSTNLKRPRPRQQLMRRLPKQKQRKRKR